jgi:hypothetical protein
MLSEMKENPPTGGFNILRKVKMCVFVCVRARARVTDTIKYNYLCRPINTVVPI